MKFSRVKKKIFPASEFSLTDNTNPEAPFRHVTVRLEEGRACAKLLLRSEAELAIPGRIRPTDSTDWYTRTHAHYGNATHVGVYSTLCNRYSPVRSIES